MRKEEDERSRAPTPVQARQLFLSSEKVQDQPKITPLKSSIEEQPTAEKSPTPNLVRPDLVIKDPIRIPKTPMEPIIESPDEEEEESDDQEPMPSKFISLPEAPKQSIFLSDTQDQYSYAMFSGKKRIRKNASYEEDKIEYNCSDPIMLEGQVLWRFTEKNKQLIKYVCETLIEEVRAQERMF